MEEDQLQQDVLHPEATFDADETEPIMVHGSLSIENHSDENVLYKMKINFNKTYCTLKAMVGYLRPRESLGSCSR